MQVATESLAETNSLLNEMGLMGMAATEARFEAQAELNLGYQSPHGPQVIAAAGILAGQELERQQQLLRDADDQCIATMKDKLLEAREACEQLRKRSTCSTRW